MITTRRYFGQVDRRSRFTTVSMGWRTASDGVPRLRDAISRAGEHGGPANQPVALTWTPGDGAVIMTATLPEVAARSWIENVINAEHLGVREFGDPVLAVVGSAGVLEELEGSLRTMEKEGPPTPQLAIRSTMKQTTAQGFEQTFIIGQDPAADVGFAAAFLAMCLIAGGPGTLLPDAIQKSGYQAILQASRGLQDSTPTVTWQVIASRPDGSAVLETALSTVAGFSVAEHAEAVEQAREFARTNLNRAWQSPLELARSLAHYEVMGWSGELVRNPDAAVDHVAPAAIEHAVEGLVRPIKEILGRS
ncbi:hypothetical protein M1D89_21195 [Arthrobacter sp. D3-18]